VTGRSPDVTGVVLAGGASRRFGGDKLAAELSGVPLLHRAVDRIARVCGSVIVVIAPQAHEPSVPDGIAVRFVHDEVGKEGPLRGAAAGLAATDSEWAILAGGDMPDLQPSVLTALLRFGSDREAAAAALGEGTGFRPLPCALLTEPARERAEELLSQGERSLRSLLSSLSAAVLEEETWLRLDPGRRTLHDVDEPSDLGDPS
jgi:molybdopterin-guanine dinucleotide biosynthesis protein A